MSVLSRLAQAVTETLGLGDRVVHVASGREWRGGERQVLLLTKALARLGVDQVVVTRASGRLARELADAGIATRPVGWRFGPSPSALIAAVREAGRRPSILHAHDAHSLTLVGIAARISHRPFVVTRRVDLPLRRRGLWPNAASIIAISDAVRRQLERSGIPADRIVVVRSGVAPPLVAAARPQRSAPVVVSIGALTPEKNHRLLLESAARLQSAHPDLRWRIAGDGPLRTQLEAQTRALGLMSTVEFLGELEDPRSLLADATIFASCSLREGLGTSILDAMAASVPVVATAVGGVTEVLADGAGMLVDQPGPEPFAAAIEATLRDETSRRNVIRKAAARIPAYSAERMATEVLTVYRSVVLSRW